MYGITTMDNEYGNDDTVACASCGDPLDPDEGDNFCASCSWLVLSARKGGTHGHSAHFSAG